ncbi:MAG TPA: hypothetical protein VER04_00400 [Polyangiaceae bacterium]|nr:hypothetical protein [Polyangiaceae bacterium]
MVVNAAVPRVTPKSRPSAALFGIAFGALLFGCGFHRDGAAAARLRARIRTELGSEASVNVRSAYGSTTVTIRLERMPNLDSLLVQERVEAWTKAEFPQTAYVVVLGKP